VFRILLAVGSLPAARLTGGWVGANTTRVWRGYFQTESSALLTWRYRRQTHSMHSKLCDDQIALGNRELRTKPAWERRRKHSFWGRIPLLKYSNPSSSRQARRDCKARGISSMQGGCVRPDIPSMTHVASSPLGPTITGSGVGHAVRPAIEAHSAEMSLLCG